MTYVLELAPETVRFLEKRAAQLGVASEKVAEQILAQARVSVPDVNLMETAEQLFNERASAYEALAEGVK